MKKIKTEKGITLVALIITIVVLLILATVAITSMQESDIIGYTNNAAMKYNGTVTNESGILGEYENFLGNHSVGTENQDELAGTWVFNDEIYGSDAASEYTFNFTSNTYNFYNITFKQPPEGNTINSMTYYGDDLPIATIGPSGWADEAYKTITITSKLSEVSNGEELLTWLQSNATKQ